MFLKELSDFYRFFWRISKKDKKIIFYSERNDYYPYFEGLIKELVKRYNETLCYISSDPTDQNLINPIQRISTFYINKLLPFFMAFVDCKAFIMTLTDLNRYHLKRSVNQVSYVYVFHAAVSTHMMYRYGAFDHYDYILCVGPHHIKEIRRHEEINKLRQKKLVEAGYYRLERIYNAYQEYSKKRDNSINKKTILIAPSWGTANILESYGERLIELLLNAGYKVIVRPHPETVKRSPKLINSLAYKFTDNADFTLERSISSDDSLLCADVLISDCSGIALEYAFGTERPVLFLDVPIKIKNPKFKELRIEPLELSLRPQLGMIVSPMDLGKIPSVIHKLISERASYKNRISELREQIVFSFGHSSEIGAKCIMNIAEGNENRP